ncbi:MAG: hypothetical protein WC378_00210 [Opitutaceae bacterium]|jgi:hypothetical protein
MPCYEVRTVSVEFQAAHKDLLIKAIQALGWTYAVSGARVLVRPQGGYEMTVDLSAGVVVAQDQQQFRVNELKRAYSVQAIKQTAKLNGWLIETENVTKGAFVREML